MTSIPTVNVFGTLIPNELNDANIIGDVLQSQYTFCSFATTQVVLLRASSTIKVKFLCKIFDEIKDHKYARMAFVLLVKHFQGNKLTKYLSTLDRSEYIRDIYGKDDNRTMSTTELNTYLESTLVWFRFLMNTDLQMGIFLSFLSMCGNCVITRILYYIQEIYKQEVSFSYKITSAASGLYLSYANASSVLHDGYIEDWDDSDPDVQLIFKRRTEWDEAMAKYRSKVEMSINGPDESKKKAGGKSSVESDRKSKSKGKGKKAHESKKEKKTTKDTKSKKGRKSNAQGSKTTFMPEIDFIQLMPIWISMKIFQYLDEKTLKLIKEVNIYWEFVVTCLSQEEKGRKKVDLWIESLEDEYKLKGIVPVHPISVKPELRFRRRDRNILIACDPEVHKSIKEQWLLSGFQPPCANTSLISEIANNPEVSFLLPVNNLQPFQRMISDDPSFDRTQYIHQRPSCIHFDNVTVSAKPIYNIDFTSEFIDEIQHLQKTSSFDFWPEVIREYQDSQSKIIGRTTSAYLARWNPLNKHIEMERMLNTMVERSIARFRNTINNLSRRTLATSDERTSTEKLSKEEATKKSIQLEMIHTSLQLEVLSTDTESEYTVSDAPDDIEEKELITSSTHVYKLDKF